MTGGRFLLDAGTVVARRSLSGKGSSALSLGGRIGIIVGAFVVLLIVLTMVWWFLRRLRPKMVEDVEFLDNLPGVPPRFAYKQLMRATNSFRMKLGGTGSGQVYEGVLPNGMKIAVKKLSKQVGDLDFRAEVATMGGISHDNILQLKGFCDQGPHRLLVYEYMAHGSLDRWIFPGDGGKYLDWDRRFKIGLGAAKGLAYLHDDCVERIVHFDMKPQNILLNENFVPKVAEFGLSKVPESVQGSEVITTMRGTPGYVAPEWILGVAITEKGDVYSFGLVLFELMSGRRNLDESGKIDDVYFPAAALQEVRERGYGKGSLAKLLDPRMRGLFDEEQARRMMQVAFWCIQENPEQRPNMKEVVLMLDGTLQILNPPFLWFAGLHPSLNALEREKLKQLAFSRFMELSVAPRG